MDFKINPEWLKLLSDGFSKLAPLISLEEKGTKLGLTSGSLDEKITLQLCRFISLVKKWSKVFSLVSFDTDKELIEKHVLDSILVSEIIGYLGGVRSVDDSLGSTTKILDIGSGAGFPGIILQILNPDSQVILCEPREKRVNFLKTCRAELGLTNLIIYQLRIEDCFKDSHFQASLSALKFVVSRAVGLEEHIINLFHRYNLSPPAKSQLFSGIVSIMAGPSWQQELTVSFDDNKSKLSIPSSEIHYQVQDADVLSKRKFVYWKFPVSRET